MSFESSDDEQDTIVVHSLPWRSTSKPHILHDGIPTLHHSVFPELNNFLKELDK